MKKRNLVLFGTAATLALAIAGTVGTIAASAAENLTPSHKSDSIEISYSVEDSWTVTLPESITIGGDAAEISASDVNVETGKKLQVTVTSENYSEGWKLKNGENSIDYKLKAGADEGSLQDLTDNGVVLEVASGTTEGSAKIKAETENTASTGGQAYTDTLTFNADVVEA